LLRGTNVLRITLVERESADGTALRLEGRLAGAWVDELRQACERHRSRTLDLKGLQSVDGAGLILLRQLVLDGVALQHLSGYLTELMADPP
jgi:hypothetical protein